MGDVQLDYSILQNNQVLHLQWPCIFSLSPCHLDILSIVSLYPCHPITFVVTAMQLSCDEIAWVAPVDLNTWSVANAWAAPELLTVHRTVYGQEDNPD